MPLHRSTPYTFTPTRDGRKLPWELGRPEVRDIPAEPSDSEAVSSTRSSGSPTPQRPGRLFDRWAAGERLNTQEPAQPAAPAPEPVRAAPRTRRRRQPVCTCGDCPPDMPTRVEQKCCMEEDLSSTHLTDFRQGTCIYNCEEIKHLFHRVSLRICWLSQRQYLHMTGDDLHFRHMKNENYRYHAYRSYVKYIYGLLGKFNRKVVPACLVKRIREFYPSDSGSYVGYVHINPETGEEVPHDELEQLRMELEGE